MDGILEYASLSLAFGPDGASVLRMRFSLVSLLFVCLSLSSAWSQDLTRNGRLVIVGGALSSKNDEVFNQLLQSRKSRSELVVAIISAASSKPTFYADAFRDQLVERGLTRKNIIVVRLAVKDDSTTPDVNEADWAENGDLPVIKRQLERADIVWFSGGDQSRITQVLYKDDHQPTQALKALDALLQRGGTIGGTSAGAAMMSELMIVGGSSAGALFKGVADEDSVDQEGGPLLIGKGMGFFPFGIIDQHFDAKARLGRLIVALSSSPSAATGFGIDEDTALVVDLASQRASVAGPSRVTVVQSVQTENKKPPYSFEDIRISSLGSGDQINLSSMTYMPANDKKPTVGSEYYNIPSPSVTGALSGYGTLNQLLAVQLIDNAAAESVTSFLFDEQQALAYRLTFRQDETSKGFWCYRNGQEDHYTVIDALLSIQPVTISIGE